ncbi:hypothetical protein HanRHA438_Chr01g0017181 [Helianthus annuus]|nr:hypothetical protein HanHA300_Chr01g0013871 [Helianthus annuus]KAJ0622315.1 hypothetical protein HanIR_Chr01g0018611 [Helianthus annuus]KAJ0626591.1 hypothetical protein HanHA89_Chr01g0014921 [Helianthus annuus]KAJ0782935.1 hypothetical protein HanLR1_Chr01g0013881 [Helianthus annuus]KAJ0947615.1 hypothetical protein HanRHA438_Chr01g0017181 [Helianthus annuus]
MNPFIYIYVCMYRCVCVRREARLPRLWGAGCAGPDLRGAVWGTGAGPSRASAGPHTHQS